MAPEAKPYFIAHGVKSSTEALEIDGQLFFREIDVTQGLSGKQIIIQHNGILGAIGRGQKLQEFLAVLNNDNSIPIIDIQHPRGKDFVPRLSSCIGDRPVIICGTKHRVVSSLCAIRPKTRRPFYSIGQRKDFEKYQREQERLINPAGFSVKSELIDEELLEKLKKTSSDALVLAFKVNNPEEALILAEMGVNGFFTDNPQLLQAAFAKP